MSFRSDRLIIRPTLEQDSDLIYQLMNSPKFIKYVGDRQLYSMEDAEKYIQDKMLPQLHSHGYSNYSLINKKMVLKLVFVDFMIGKDWIGLILDLVFYQNLKAWDMLSSPHQE